MNARRRRLALGGALAMVLLVAAVVWDSVRVRWLDVGDERAFEAYLDASGERPRYRAFVDFLGRSGVGHVVAPWQLWRQGDEWHRLDEPPFAAPARERWGSIVPTLVVVRDEIEPRFGPVEVVSGFRTERYNQRAGGAGGSRHRSFEAIDVVPRRWWTRWGLRMRLAAWWRERGEPLHVGLGLYAGTRFHLDTHAYRRW